MPVYNTKSNVLHYRRFEKNFADDWGKMQQLDKSTLLLLCDKMLINPIDVAKLKYPQLMNLDIATDEREMLFIIVRDLALKFDLYT